MQADSASREPLVSIIINNYNYGRFLSDAIDSALRQTYPQLEVIVVDDGSTDNSRDIIASYGAQLTPILKENCGQASAFNSGFAQCRGDLVIFLDSDDMLLPDTAQRVSWVYEQTPNVAKIQYRMGIINAEGMRTGVIKPPPHLPVPSGELRREVLAFPFDMTWMATSGNAFATRVLRQIFPMPEREFRILADYYLSHLTPLFGPVVALNEIGAYYRVHGANNYEPSNAKLNLEQLRRTIIHSKSTQLYIQKYAKQLGLRAQQGDDSDAQSVSLLAERLISVKLDPAHHPIAGDTIARLFWLGITASLHRFDVPAPIKILFLTWFAAMVPAPKPVAHWLAEKFYFPETRGALNRLLGALHRMHSPVH